MTGCATARPGGGRRMPRRGGHQWQQRGRQQRWHPIQRMLSCCIQRCFHHLSVLRQGSSAIACAHEPQPCLNGAEVVGGQQSNTAYLVGGYPGPPSPCLVYKKKKIKGKRRTVPKLPAPMDLWISRSRKQNCHTRTSISGLALLPRRCCCVRLDAGEPPGAAAAAASPAPSLLP